MKYRNLLLIVLVLLVVGGVTAIVSSSRKTEDTPTNNSGASATARNVAFTINEGELKKWVIAAEDAEYFQDRTGAKLTNIHGEVFDDEGNVIVVFTAPKGEYKNENNQVLLTGGVRAQTTDEENPVIVTAPEMKWSAQSERVLASGGVKLAHKLFGESSAQNCRFNLNLTAIALEGGVVTSLSKP